MNCRMFIALAIMCAGGPVVALQAQSQPWVVATVSGQERVAFLPRPEPYTTGGPAVSVPVPADQSLKLASGESVEGFEFIGWHEGQAIRVVVRALVLRAREGSSMPPLELDRHERRQIATMRLVLGSAVEVKQIRELGALPVTLRVAER